MKRLLKKALSICLASTLMTGALSCSASESLSNNHIDTYEETPKLMANTLDYEKRLTPVMGWASWNALGHGINDERLMAQMNALVSTGLADAGYVYFNIDDTYQNGRDETTGRLKINHDKFPYGMKKYADEAHSRGLYAGMYTDGGDNSCASSNDPVNKPWGIGVGLLGHERDDLYMYLGEGNYRDTYAQNNPDDPGIECWGYDFIKVDWCGGGHAQLDDEEQYTKIGNIITEIEEEFGKDKIYNICRWAYRGPWQLKADSWRIGGDIDMSGNSFDSVMVQVDKMKTLSYLTGPGHVNDPDMMVVGKGLTAEEDKTHFALWCMFSAPLMIGCDLTKISQSTLELLKNEELIAINQDPACLSASYLGNIGNEVEVWLKPLGSVDSDTMAIAFVNRSKVAQSVSYKFSEIGYTGKVNIRDLFEHCDLEADTAVSMTLGSHETAIYKISPTEKAPLITLSSSLSQVSQNVTLAGTDGVDFAILSAPAQNAQITHSTVGTIGEYTPSVTYNGVSKGVSVSGETAELAITLPSIMSESTATVYFGGNQGSVDIISSIGGKAVSKSVTLDGTAKAYSVRFYSSSPEDRLTITLKGDVFADAVSISSSITGSGSALLSETLPSPYDLTANGTADWLFYGASGSFRGVRKNGGGSQITVRTNAGENLTASGTGVVYRWTDGDIQQSAVSARGGCRAYGVGEGYSIFFPADSSQKHIEMPFGVYNADAKVEFIVDNEVLLSQTVTGRENAMTTRFFTADYSADGQTTAQLKITIENEYSANAFVLLEGVALSCEGESFSHSSVGAGVEAFDVEADAIDWVKYGTSASRKEGVNLISDYITSTSTIVSTTDSGDFIGDYSAGIELPLPVTNTLSRADICLEVKDAVVGINVYTGGTKNYTTISDIDGGKNAVVSVWYEGGVRAGVTISVKGKIAQQGGFALKSVSLYENVDYVADYPTVEEANGSVSASLLAKTTGEAQNASFVIDFCGESGVVSSVSTPITITNELATVNATAQIPQAFEAGSIKTYVTLAGGERISKISCFDYPLTRSISSADVENRIGGITAKYLVQTQNALLLDVRSAAEYEAGHIDGAINIEYTSIIDNASTLIPDKNTFIIAYCSSAKRSAQAVLTLTAMGYENAYNLGEMTAYDVVPTIALPDTNTKIWTPGERLYVSCPEIGKYDKVEIKYSEGESSTIADAVEYDSSSGIEITDSGNGSYYVKAYLVFSDSGEIIAQASNVYNLSIEAPAFSDIGVFVSDLNYTLSGSLTNYVKKDTSVNGETININGTLYTKGIGMNAGPETGYTKLTVGIPNNVKYFTAVVGRDRDITWSQNHKASFRVSIDGRLVASSPEISWNEEFVFMISIPENASEITLSAIGVADGNHCAWGNAGFILDPAFVVPDVSNLNIKTYLSDLNFKTNDNYMKKDLSVRETPISVAGRIYEKGVGINAGTETIGGTIESDIPSGANKFVAVAGHTDTAKNTATPVVFSIYFDDVLAESSPEMTKGEYYVFRTSIPHDAKKIKLRIITSNRDTNHCAWAIAAFTDPKHAYVSDNGSDANDGLTPESPKKTISAAATVCDSDGAVKIVDTYTTKNGEKLSSPNGVLRLEGYNESSKLKLYRAELAGETEIRNLVLGRVDAAEVPLRANGENLTIGVNVSFDGSYDNNGISATRNMSISQHDYTESFNLNNTITIRSGAYSGVYAGNQYGNSTTAGKVTLNIEDGVTIGNLGLNHNSAASTKSLFSGNSVVNINGGTISKVFVGSAGKGGSDGTQRFVLNGGTFTDIFTTSGAGGNYLGDYAHEAVLQTGVNIIEINGGVFNQKKIKMGGLDAEATRVVIFNNGMAEGFTVLDNKAIVVKADSEAKVTAITDNLNRLTGFDVATTYSKISAGSTNYSTYTTDANGINHFTIPAPENGVTLTIGYGLSAISFDLNGGVGETPQSIAASRGELITLPKTINATNGTKTFIGWSESPNGSKAFPIYTVGSNDVTLYAIWSDSYDSSYYNNFYSALMSGNATIGYIGGSITYGDGLSKYGNEIRNSLSWRGITRDWFAKNFGAKIVEVNAAINGTGTRFASYRASDHLKLSTTPPDLLFIEFAINDDYEGYAEEEIRANLKILLKKVLDANPYANFMFILTTDNRKLENDFPTLIAHRRFAQDYGIPYIDVGKAVVAEIKATGKTWTDGYFSDWVHPDKKGNEVYAKQITDYFTSEFTGKQLNPTRKDIQSFSGIDDSIDTDRYFSYISQRNDVNRDKRVGFEDTFDALGTTDSGARFAFTFTGTNALVWSSKCRFNAEVDIYVDGSHTVTTVWDTWRDDNFTQNYLYPVSETDLEYGTHTVVGILRPVFKPINGNADRVAEGWRLNMRAIAVKGGGQVTPDFTFIDMPKVATFINPYSQREMTYTTGYGAQTTTETADFNLDYTTYVYETGDRIILPTEKPVKEGESFLYWSETIGGAPVSAEALVMGQEDKTFYAVFGTSTGASVYGTFEKTDANPIVVRSSATDGFDYSSAAKVTLYDAADNSEIAVYTEPAGNASKVVEYRFDNVTATSVYVTVEKNGYVKYTSEAINTANETSFRGVRLIPGDIKGSFEEVCGDGFVDIDDLLRLLRAFNDSATAQLITVTDIDESAVVTIEDLAHIKANLGASKDSYTK